MEGAFVPEAGWSDIVTSEFNAHMRSSLENVQWLPRSVDADETIGAEIRDQCMTKARVALQHLKQQAPCRRRQTRDENVHLCYQEARANVCCMGVADALQTIDKGGGGLVDFEQTM